MTYIMVDVETDGPIPGTDEYSMILIGAIVVEPSLDRVFCGSLRPISQRWQPEALAISKYSREETMNFEDPIVTMRAFALWIAESCPDRPFFVSDNNGFDWSFINWYFHHFLKENPFGHSSINLGSLYKGVYRNMEASFKHMRKTKPTHNPADDARGNAEAFLCIMKGFGNFS